MPFNGSGVFVRLYSWVADAAAGIDITASRMDNDTNDITANGLGLCLTRDGQGQPSATTPWNNQLITELGGIVFSPGATITGGIFVSPAFATRIFTGATPLVIVVADYRVVVEQVSPAALAVTLPLNSTVALGQEFIIKDGSGVASTYPMTITPSSGTIDGQPTYVLGTNFGEVKLVYYGNNAWGLE